MLTFELSFFFQFTKNIILSISVYNIVKFYFDTLRFNFSIIFSPIKIASTKFFKHYLTCDSLQSTNDLFVLKCLTNLTEMKQSFCFSISLALFILKLSQAV